MSKDDELFRYILQATWSIEEAAHLVHGMTPPDTPANLSDTACDPVSRTYFWLKKEYGRGRLYQVAGEGQTPRFSPGTLMRHLEEKKRFVSPHVRKLYDSAYGHLGSSNLISSWKETAIAAAKLIRKRHPDRSANAIAEDLTDLPRYYTQNILKSVAKDTIRKWLKGIFPNGKGRPRGGKSKDTEKPDLAEIVKDIPEK